MDNSYDNIDFCLDLLYNFIYKKDKKRFIYFELYKLKRN